MERAPSPRGRFVGRAALLASLQALVDGDHRLVTVWGPGGIGKTTLASEFAARWSESTRHPSIVCDLSAARTAAEAAAAVARALDTPAGRARDIAAHAGSVLSRRGPLLLVLDNYEQLPAEAALLPGQWLAAAPKLRIIATSRERLRVRDETALEVPPLGLTAAPGEQPEALQLLLARLRALDPRRTFADRELADASQLVQALDGIPLAIELAAARLEVAGMAGLLGQLHRQLDVLGRASREAPDRHATLRAAIQWSWSMLTAVEQRALAECAVFRGGFTVEAAEAVLTPPANGSVLDLLQTLRDKSLLRVDADGQGHSRFDLLESVRLFAAEAPESAAAGPRHTAYFASLALQLADEHAVSGKGAAVRALGSEQENLLAVLRQHPASREACEVLLGLEPVLFARGPIELFVELADEALASAPGIEPGLAARLSGARGRARLTRGRPDEAREDLLKACELAHEAGNPSVEAPLLIDLGVWHQQRRELPVARALYEQALELAQDKRDRRTKARALGNLGTVDHDAKSFASAVARYREAIRLFREIGDRRTEGVFRTNLALVEHEVGQTVEALEDYERALELLGDSEERRFLGITLGNAGMLHHEQGRLDLAASCHERAVRALREVGDVRSEALAQGRWAVTLACAGRPSAEAAAHLREGLDLAEASGDPLAERTLDLCRAFVALARRREAIEAGEHAGAAEALRDAQRRAQSARAEATGPSAEALSDDVRALLRLLDTELSRITAPERAAASAPASVLAISRDGSWFRAPAGETHDLSKRQALRLILVRLVEAREKTPGQALSLEDLQQAGWPGERISPEAGANRTYVTLAKLREAGLRALLLRRDDGYLLDPQVEIQRVERVGADRT